LPRYLTDLTDSQIGGGNVR